MCVDSVKCNFGISWSKTKKVCVAGWIVRNWEGKVLMYSRGAFSAINSLNEANLLGLLWAVESMCSLHVKNIIFASDVLRPGWSYHETEGLASLSQTI